MIVSIETDGKQFREILDPLVKLGAPGAAKLAMQRAVNRTAEWSRTRTLDAITGSLALKRSDLDGRHRFGGVIVGRAGGSNPEATLNVTGRRIPLYRLKGTPKTPPSRFGITYSLNTGGRSGLTTNAFTALLHSGHLGFFKKTSDAKHVKRPAPLGKIYRGKGKGIRRGKGSKFVWTALPVIELYGPSIPHVAEKQPDFQKLLQVDASERLALQLDREVSFILTGSSKKADAGDSAKDGGGDK